ncbi:MAG: tetratricopeptide repeat protein [Magnetococcales bacterium]|nr:tetratricopeptide repeat protein [Magnetococcales bacterium]
MNDNQTKKNNEMTAESAKPTELARDNQESPGSNPEITSEEQQWMDRLARTDKLMAKVMRGYGGQQPAPQPINTPAKPNSSNPLVAPTVKESSKSQKLVSSSESQMVEKGPVESGAKIKQSHNIPATNIFKHDDKTDLNTSASYGIENKVDLQTTSEPDIRKKTEESQSTSLFKKEKFNKEVASDKVVQQSIQKSVEIQPDPNKKDVSFLQDGEQVADQTVIAKAIKDKIAQRPQKRKVADDLAALRKVQSANIIGGIAPTDSQDLANQEKPSTKLEKSAKAEQSSNEPNPNLDDNEVDKIKPTQLAKKPKEAKQPVILKPSADTLGFISLVTGLETREGGDYCDINDANDKVGAVTQPASTTEPKSTKQESAANLISDTLKSKTTAKTEGFIDTVVGLEDKFILATDKPLADVPEIPLSPSSQKEIKTQDSTLQDEEIGEVAVAIAIGSKKNRVEDRVKIVVPPSPQPILAEPQPFLAEPSQVVTPESKPATTKKPKKVQITEAKEDITSRPDQLVVSIDKPDISPKQETIVTSKPKPVEVNEPVAVAKPEHLEEAKKAESSETVVVQKSDTTQKQVDEAPEVVEALKAPEAVEVPEQVVVSPVPVEVPEPVVVAPDPVRDPEPVVVAPDPVEVLEPVVVAPEPVEVPEPVFVALEPVEVPEPEVVAPEPVEVLEPVEVSQSSPVEVTYSEPEEVTEPEPVELPVNEPELLSVTEEDSTSKSLGFSFPEPKVETNPELIVEDDKGAKKSIAHQTVENSSLKHEVDPDIIPEELTELELVELSKLKLAMEEEQIEKEGSLPPPDLPKDVDREAKISAQKQKLAMLEAATDKHDINSESIELEDSDTQPISRKDQDELQLERSPQLDFFPEESRSNKKDIGRLLRSTRKTQDDDNPRELGFFFYSGVDLIRRISSSAIEGYLSLTSMDGNLKYKYCVDRGDHFFNSGQNKRAARYYERAIKERPDSTEFYGRLGVCYLRINRLSDGVSYIEKAEKSGIILPNLDEILSQAYIKQGKYKKAVSRLDKALLVSPDSFSLNFRLALALDKMGEYNRAFKVFEHCLKINPDSIKAHRAMGFSLEQAGERDLAIKYFKRAAELEEGDVHDF